jgi:hypothetical protein
MPHRQLPRRAYSRKHFLLSTHEDYLLQACGLLPIIYVADPQLLFSLFQLARSLREDNYAFYNRRLDVCSKGRDAQRNICD